MEELSLIGKDVHMVITTFIGSNNKGSVYPVNYGYIKYNDKIIKGYLLGIYDKVLVYDGKCVGIIKRIDDNNQVIVVPKDKNYSDEQIEALIDFKEREYNHFIIRNNFDDNITTLAEGLVDAYHAQIRVLKKAITKIIIYKIEDIDLIEHTLDKLLDIPIDESERLYNFLCSYLDNINKDSAKFYRLEYKNMWY